MFETTVKLKPREDWPDPDKTTRELMAEMDQAIHIPGVANAWTMPIKTRIDMLSTGIKTPVGIKVSGPDLGELARIGRDIEVALKQMPETLSIGRASCRERGCQYVSISVVDVALQKKNN